MVAAARLRRAEERALGTRPYAGRISALLQEIVSTTEGSSIRCWSNERTAPLT